MSGTAAPPADRTIGRPRLPPGRVVDTADRGRFFVREHRGPHDEAALVVLLHGATVSGSLNWYPAYRELARHAHVVSIDHRGHGRSPHRARRFRLEDAADDAAAVAAALGHERFVAVGYSMGGAVAQLTARRHHERVSGLVLGATWARLVDWPRTMALRSIGVAGTATRVLARRHQLDIFLRLAGRLSSLATHPPWHLAEVRSGSVPMMLESFGAIARFDSRPWLSELAMPTGVLVLDDDEVVPPRVQIELAGRIDHAEVRHLPLRHADCVNRSEVFVPALADIVDRVISRAR